MSILIGFLYFVFVVSSILLIAIVLLQEGKGGGLAEAFGGVGAETFGVKSGGINKATATIAAVFLATALAISFIGKTSLDTGIFPPGGGGSEITGTDGDGGSGDGGAGDGDGGAGAGNGGAGAGNGGDDK